MKNRPSLKRELKASEFYNYYYLKEELVIFCKQEGLQATGGKEVLTKRIAHYLETGEKLTAKTQRVKKTVIDTITKDSQIEPNFVCSEKHRSFFKESVGPGFSFNVEFQKWLKANTGKTYQQAIEAYYELRKEKKNKPLTIEKQFEYNTYIRDFFADNTENTLEDAICCWKYKKSLPGHNRYEREDRRVLSSQLISRNHSFL